MKTLSRFCDRNNLVLLPIKFRHKNYHITGYAVLDKDGQELVTLEPGYVHDEGKIWHIHFSFQRPSWNECVNYNYKLFLGTRHIIPQRISSFLHGIEPDFIKALFHKQNQHDQRKQIPSECS